VTADIRACEQEFAGKLRTEHGLTAAARRSTARQKDEVRMSMFSLKHPPNHPSFSSFRGLAGPSDHRQQNSHGRKFPFQAHEFNRISRTHRAQQRMAFCRRITNCRSSRMVSNRRLPDVPAAKTA